MSAIAMYPVSMWKKARRVLTGKKEEEGASLAEYGLLIALIAAVCVGVITLLGTQIQAVFQYLVDKIVVPSG